MDNIILIHEFLTKTQLALALKMRAVKQPKTITRPIFRKILTSKTFPGQAYPRLKTKSLQRNLNSQTNIINLYSRIVIDFVQVEYRRRVAIYEKSTNQNMQILQENASFFVKSINQYLYRVGGAQSVVMGYSASTSRTGFARKRGIPCTNTVHPKKV